MPKNGNHSKRKSKGSKTADSAKRGRKYRREQKLRKGNSAYEKWDTFFLTLRSSYSLHGTVHTFMVIEVRTKIFLIYRYCTNIPSFIHFCVIPYRPCSECYKVESVSKEESLTSGSDGMDGWNVIYILTTSAQKMMSVELLFWHGCLFSECHSRHEAVSPDYPLQAVHFYFLTLDLYNY